MKPLKIMLAASGGGHVRQLLDLQPVWGDRDYVFVTEDTALGRSLAARHPVRFVDHYALGQARLGDGGKMLISAARNLRQSVRIAAELRPDVVITSGAGAVYWTALAAKARGAKVILMDSFARFDRPSKFARALRPFANETIVQSAALKDYWPSARLFDPLRLLEGPAPAKDDLLFATVGATLAFPRLTKAVLALKASGKLPERVILQGGEGARPDALPAGVQYHDTLPFDRIRDILQSARFVVCHGGTGSLVTALSAGCKTVAMPRRADLGEHYDDHQSEITSSFRARGLVEIADDADALGQAIEALRGRPARLATTDPQALIGFLNQTLDRYAV